MRVSTSLRVQKAIGFFESSGVLEGRTRLFQKLHFFSSGSSAEDMVPVRESPKTPYDFTVLDGVIHVVFNSKMLKKVHGLILNEEGLTVHEGHVEEGFLLSFQMMMVTYVQGFLREGQGLRISTERSRCFTMNVSGKLV